MYKSESTLGLIASILRIVASVILLAVMLILILLSNTALELPRFFNHVGIPFASNIFHMATGIVVIIMIVSLLVTVASAVLGFIGVSQLNRNDKNGGVLLIVAGGLSLLSLHGFISMILFLIGGIMALSKKVPAPPIS